MGVLLDPLRAADQSGAGVRRRHGASGLPGATVKKGEREGLTVGPTVSVSTFLHFSAFPFFRFSNFSELIGTLKHFCKICKNSQSLHLSFQTSTKIGGPK